MFVLGQSPAWQSKEQWEEELSRRGGSWCAKIGSLDIWCWCYLRLVSCVVIQTALGRRYSELMDGRITIRRMENGDTLSPSQSQVNTFKHWPLICLAHNFKFPSNQRLSSFGIKDLSLSYYSKRSQDRTKDTWDRPDSAFQFFTFPTNDLSMLGAVDSQWVPTICFDSSSDIDLPTFGRRRQ